MPPKDRIAYFYDGYPSFHSFFYLGVHYPGNLIDVQSRIFFGRLGYTYFSEDIYLFCHCMTQEMLEMFILVQIIPWSPTVFVWRITLSSLTISTRRWRYMSVERIFYDQWIYKYAYHSYFLLVDFRIQRPHKAYPTELAQFHSPDYVEFLYRITPDTQHLFSSSLLRCMYASIH